jgi:hypothetical protein
MNVILKLNFNLTQKFVNYIKSIEILFVITVNYENIVCYKHEI